MHFELGHVLMISALIGSVIMVLHRDDRLFPVIAALSSGLMTLMMFNIISLSSGKLRIDVILAAVLTISAAIVWARCTTKPTITAATVATFAGAIMLMQRLSMI
jgi:hypothetical protein